MAREAFPPLPVYRWDASVPYREAARRQEECVARGHECLILCEHPATITLGTGAGPDDLAGDGEFYARRGIEICRSPRGGKATYHGPGQLVGYPILNLRGRGVTIHGHLRFLEELMIAACDRFGVSARRIEGRSGAWAGNKKIGFVGIRVRQGYAFHGFSLNVTPQHDPFRWIVPCGMPGLEITSLEEERGDRGVPVWEAAEVIEGVFFERLGEMPLASVARVVHL